MIIPYGRVPLQLSKKKLDSCNTVVNMWKLICFSFSNLYRPNFFILDNNCVSAAGNAM